MGDTRMVRPPGCMREVFMPYEHDIRDLKNDIRDEGITSTVIWTVSLAMFAVAAVMIWFVMAAH